MDGFLGIGFWEVLLILVVILALLGPRRLPEIAARLGTLYRSLRRASFDLTSTLAKEVEGTPYNKGDNPLDSLKKAASDLKLSLTKETESTPHNEDESPEEEGSELNRQS